MNLQRILDDNQISGSYPASWDGFIGQNKTKRQLRVACLSAKQRNEPLGHVLLASGDPGIGKTTLALLVAAELDTNMKIVSGKMKRDQARITLSRMSDRDVLFIDEAHQLVAGGKTDAEWLLHLLQDGVIIGPRGPEQQARITVIAATTDAARIPDTIIHRFAHRPALKPYTDEEGAFIAIKTAARVFHPEGPPMPSTDDFRRIARAANNNPRIIGAIVSNLRDLAEVDLEMTYDAMTGNYHLDEALDWLGLTEDGLTDVARRYLIVLMDDFEGMAGERAIADRLNEAGLRSVEQLLMTRGLIFKTKQGRVLSKEGINRAIELKKEASCEPTL